MKGKRIRCDCGRVYRPAENPKCPSCGAEAKVAILEEVELRKEEAEPPRSLSDDDLPPPTFLQPRSLLIGGSILLALILFVLLVRSGNKPEVAKDKAVAPIAAQTATPAPGAAVTATAAPVASPTPFGSQSVIAPQAFDLAAAIASAAPGATIKVPAGFYPGGIVLTKAVRIVGTPGVMIQSDGRECLSVRAPGVFVQNVQFICNGIGELPAISVTEGADLELDGCRIQSMTGLGVALNGKAGLKGIGTSFTASNGVALRIGAGKVKLTQSTISDSKVGLSATQSAAAGEASEFESCAFERNGLADPQGGIMVLMGNVAVALTDCHITHNTGGILLLDNAVFGMWRGSFKNNLESASTSAMGLVAARRGAKATFANVSFEGNGQGVAASDRGIVELDQCTFNRNGSQTRQLILPAMPLSVAGRDARVVVKNTRIMDSAQFAISAMNAGSLTLENVEISGARTCAIGIGDTGSAPVKAEIRRARISGNQTGLGVFANSRVTVEESEFSENNEGIIVGERECDVELRKTQLLGNREHGLVVYGESKAHAVESQFRGNGRGVQSGTPRKSSGRGSLTLEDCAVGANRIFGVGAYAQSELVLTRVNFEGGDKQNIYKERGAIVQSEAAANPAAEASATPEVSPGPSETPEASATPGARKTKPTPRPRRTPRAEDEAARILRQIFRPR